MTSPVVQSVGPAQQAPRIWVSGKGPSHRTKGNAQGVGPAWLETSTLGPFLGNLTKSLEHSPAWLVGVQPGRALKAQKARTLSWETIKTRTKPSAQRYLVQVFVFLRTKFKNNLKIQDQGIIKHILAQAFTGTWQSSRSVPAMCTPTHTAHYTTQEPVSPVSQCLRHKAKCRGHEVFEGQVQKSTLHWACDYEHKFYRLLCDPEQVT